MGDSALPTKTLSEYASSELLRAAGIPLARQRLAADPKAAARAAEELGFPVVVKLCGEAIAHKKTVPLESDVVETARSMGVCLGD